MAGIDLRDVSKSYGDVSVIERLSLSVTDGEFICFLGPSGCGKSTLLRMIAGLESVDGGHILIDGQRVEDQAPGARGVSMVFQHYALYPHMTVFNNMAFGLRNIAVPADQIESRIAEAARTLEIEPLLQRRPGQLSGGQRQRVAIGRALVRQPKAFLFDEPLSNLDAALRLRTRFELARLHQATKATMIFVTHDQVEAMTLADRIVVMNNRRIEQVGTPLEVYNQPATRFVAEFVGAPPMNFLNVMLEQVEDGVLATLASGAQVRLAIPFAAMVSNTATLGIRAEDLKIGKGSLSGQVQVVERLGERTLVHLVTPAGEKLIASDGGRSEIAVGDTVELSLDARLAHLFDAAGNGYHPLHGKVRHD